jgi:methylated-DNA-[protein]-cysteine S-methyltransferase
MRWRVVSTPIGDVSLATDGAGLCRVHFGRYEGQVAESSGRLDLRSAQLEEAVSSTRLDLRSAQVEEVESGDPVLARAAEQLDEYFAGRRTEFDLPLAELGGSDFERAVWAQLAEIPYGEMRTYGAVAKAVGDPSAARAVGVACNRNPVAIVLPCHRVVGAGGKLVGFGGGLPTKRFLLELEARVRVEHDFAL